MSLVPVPAITGTVTASATARHSSTLLGVGQHRALAGRAGDHQAVAAVVGQPPGQGDRAVDVERAVVVERRHHGGHHRAESPGPE